MSNEERKFKIEKIEKYKEKIDDYTANYERNYFLTGLLGLGIFLNEVVGTHTELNTLAVFAGGIAITYTFKSTLESLAKKTELETLVEKYQEDLGISKEKEVGVKNL